MKVVAMLSCFIFGLVLCLMAFMNYSRTVDYVGLWILIRIIVAGGPVAIALLSFRIGVGFFKSWQFDMQLQKMYQEYVEAKPGRLALDCQSERLAGEFWHQYKGLEKDRIYDREKYDPINKKMKFKKRF